jgi:hypothetical protein
MAREYHMAYNSHDAGGVLYVNTFTVKSDAVVPLSPEASDQKVVDEVHAWLTTLYRACLSADYTVDRLTAFGILGHESEKEHAIGLAGTLASIGGGPLPKECVCVLTLKTETPGRSGRGRMFIPSPRQANYVRDPTEWQPPSAIVGNQYTTAITAFRDALLAGHDFTEASLNYHLSARVWSRTDGLTRDVSSGIVRLPVRWLRSRSTAP